MDDEDLPPSEVSDFDTRVIAHFECQWLAEMYALPSPDRLAQRFPKGHRWAIEEEDTPQTNDDRMIEAVFRHHAQREADATASAEARAALQPRQQLPVWYRFVRKLPWRRRTQSKGMEAWGRWLMSTHRPPKRESL